MHTVKRNCLEAQLANQDRYSLGFVHSSCEYDCTSAGKFVQQEDEIEILEGMWYEELEEVAISDRN
jgi:hypothetical protein